MEKWDSNDWQGKKRQQISYSTGLVFVAITLLILFVIILGLIYWV